MDRPYLSKGTWQGYYKHFGSRLARDQDHPMKRICFELVGEYVIRAEECIDSIEDFSLELSQQGNDASFAGWKQYKDAHNRWYWQLKPAPIGLSGNCGTLDAENHRMRPRGGVWLWKS